MDPREAEKRRRELQKARLDAFTRLAVWGPIGLYAGLGREIPAPLKFISIGASILQISYGWRDFKRLTEQTREEGSAND